MRIVYKIVTVRNGVMGSSAVHALSRYHRTYEIGKKTRGVPGAPLFAYDSLEAVLDDYSGTPGYNPLPGNTKLLKCVATRPHAIPSLFRKKLRSFVSPWDHRTQEEMFSAFHAGTGNPQETMGVHEGTVFCGSIFPIEEVQLEEIRARDRTVKAQ